jgi:hypothetical protein
MLTSDDCLESAVNVVPRDRVSRSVLRYGHNVQTILVVQCPGSLGWLVGDAAGVRAPRDVNRAEGAEGRLALVALVALVAFRTLGSRRTGGSRRPCRPGCPREPSRPRRPRGGCPALKSFFSSEPLITCRVPTLFGGSSVVAAAYDVPPSANSSATYATRLRRRCRTLESHMVPSPRSRDAVRSTPKWVSPLCRKPRNGGAEMFGKAVPPSCVSRAGIRPTLLGPRGCLACLTPFENWPFGRLLGTVAADS